MDKDNQVEFGDRHVVASFHFQGQCKQEWCDDCGKKPWPWQKLTTTTFYHAPQSDRVEQCNACGLKRVKSPCDGCEDMGYDECIPECKDSCFYCCARPMFMTGSYRLCGGCNNNAKNDASKGALTAYCSSLWWNAQA